MLPQGFVYLTDIDPLIVEDMRYYISENFIGRKVTGYNCGKVVCTKEAATALALVNKAMHIEGYKLVIYDAYRPAIAVDEFVKWGKDIHDIIAKEKYYPNLSKEDLFKLGYIATASTHSRGSSFDLTIITLDQNIKKPRFSYRMLEGGKTIPFLDDNTVDMGSSFDLFDELSHLENTLINKEQQQMRYFLQEKMKKYGFIGLYNEWWHFTLLNEPYPDTYFDFEIN